MTSWRSEGGTDLADHYLAGALSALDPVQPVGKPVGEVDLVAVPAELVAGVTQMARPAEA